MKIIPSGQTPGTDSERLFAEYLDTYGYHGWLFEPTIEGCTKHPDFLIPSHEQHLLFDAKERRRKGGEPSCAWIDPMAGIREEIEEGRRKFKTFKDFSCSLVIYNAGDIDTLLEPEFVFGAMLGDPGLTLAFDVARGCLLPETARSVFLPQGGKMMRYKTTEVQNTTISAINILEQRELANPKFDRAVDEAIIAAQQQSKATLTDDDRATIAITQWFELRPSSQKVVRVRVCEHPQPRIPLSRAYFCGEYDERWAIVNGRLERIFEGDRVATLSS